MVIKIWAPPFVTQKIFQDATQNAHNSLHMTKNDTHVTLPTAGWIKSAQSDIIHVCRLEQLLGRSPVSAHSLRCKNKKEHNIIGLTIILSLKFVCECLFLMLDIMVGKTKDSIQINSNWDVIKNGTHFWCWTLFRWEWTSAAAKMGWPWSFYKLSLLLLKNALKFYNQHITDYRCEIAFFFIHFMV